MRQPGATHIRETDERNADGPITHARRQRLAAEARAYADVTARALESQAEYEARNGNHRAAQQFMNVRAQGLRAIAAGARPCDAFRQSARFDTDETGS